MIEVGLQRLYDMQHANGAWGWWKDSPDDVWMTAYVLAGLGEACLHLASNAGATSESTEPSNKVFSGEMTETLSAMEFL